MDECIERWTAKRKAALVVEIIQGKTTVSEASRSFDLSPSEIEGGVEEEFCCGRTMAFAIGLEPMAPPMAHSSQVATSRPSSAAMV